MTTAYDNTYNLQYVSIVPTKFSVMDAANSTRLYLKILDSDMATYCNIEWWLRDDNNTIYATNTVTMSGSDYTAWAFSSFANLATYILSILNLTAA